MGTIYTAAKTIGLILLVALVVAELFVKGAEIYHYEYIKKKQQKQYQLMQQALEVMADQMDAMRRQKEYTERILNATKLKHFAINDQLKKLQKITEEAERLESSFNSDTKRRRQNNRRKFNV